MDSALEPLRECSPPDPQNFKFYPSELWEKKCLLFLNAVVICCGSFRKLIHFFVVVCFNSALLYIVFSFFPSSYVYMGQWKKEKYKSQFQI